MTRKPARAVLAAASVLLGAPPLPAQEATVLGGRGDHRGRRASVPGAVITIEVLGVTVVTDDDGRYAITVPAESRGPGG